jgi:hypothetical protein
VALVRIIVMFCLALAGLRVWAAPLGFKIPEWPPSSWADMWYGPQLYGTERAQIETRLTQLPGKQLVIVRYSSTHNTLDEWVYNQANIDAAKVVWAREMDAANNQELLNYYRDRKAWLVQVDAKPATVTPYPAPELPTTAAH